MSNYRIATKSGKPFGSDWMKGLRDDVLNPLDLQQKLELDQALKCAASAAVALDLLLEVSKNIGLDLSDANRARRAVYLCDEILRELRARAGFALERYRRGERAA